MAIVEFDDVSFSYDGETDVLDHLSLRIEQGEHVVVLGHNGSGKSTMARCVNALVVPDSGTVRVAGLDTADPANLHEIRRRAGLVFQNPDDQMVTSVVADDVAFGPENLGVPQPQIVERVEAALAAVGMSEFAESDPSELSGGQRQRVAVAGMLAMHPDILVLDESGSMLDPKGRADVSLIARELNGRGVTVVQITHFMDEALEADRVVVLDRGAVALEGSPDEVFSHGDELRSLGLEQPFAMRLAQRLAALGADVPDTPRLDMLEEALCRLRSNG